MDQNIRRSLAKQLPKRAIVDLSDKILIRELNHNDDEYRVIMSLRCVHSLSKKRVTSLLEQYVNTNNHRYYNSVHWLDLGASLPQRLAITIADRQLALY